MIGFGLLDARLGSRFRRVRGAPQLLRLPPSICVKEWIEPYGTAAEL